MAAPNAATTATADTTAIPIADHGPATALELAAWYCEHYKTRPSYETMSSFETADLWTSYLQVFSRLKREEDANSYLVSFFRIYSQAVRHTSTLSFGCNFAMAANMWASVLCTMKDTYRGRRLRRALRRLLKKHIRKVSDGEARLKATVDVWLINHGLADWMHAKTVILASN